MTKKLAAILAALILTGNSPVYADEIVIERHSPGETRQIFPPNVHDEETFNRTAPVVDAPFQQPDESSRENYSPPPPENPPATSENILPDVYPEIEQPFQRPPENTSTETPVEQNNTPDPVLRPENNPSEVTIEQISENQPEQIPEEPAPENSSTGNPPQVYPDEGLEFLVHNEDGVMAFAVIAAHENYMLRPLLAKNQIPGLATVGQTNPANAIASINASYFSPTGILYGVTKVEGQTVGTSEFIRSAIGINSDGTAIFGRIKYEGKVTMGGETHEVTGVDCEREVNALVIYNRLFGERTRTNDYGTEFVVENGVVTAIFVKQGNNYIPPHGYIISAHGHAAADFINVQVGDPAVLEENFINADQTGDFNQSDYIVAAGPRLVKAGEVYVTSGEEKFPPDIAIGRAPRSAIGVTQYGDYIFAVVDGRQEHSKGCTLEEWAEILRTKFGAVDAINLDGGGSTELIVKGEIVNSPCYGYERKVGSIISILPKGN